MQDTGAARDGMENPMRCIVGCSGPCGDLRVIVELLIDVPQLPAVDC